MQLGNLHFFLHQLHFAGSLEHLDSLERQFHYTTAGEED